MNKLSVLLILASQALAIGQECTSKDNCDASQIPDGSEDVEQVSLLQGGLRGRELKKESSEVDELTEKKNALLAELAEVETRIKEQENTAANGTSEETQNPLDTPGWTNGYGAGCAQYVRNGWCGGGRILQSWTGSPTEYNCGAVETHGMNCAVVYNNPAYHCVDCGMPTPAPTPPPAVDTPGWTNGYGASCAQYQHNGWCSGGRILQGWTGSPTEYNCGPNVQTHGMNCAIVYNNPQYNCVACGKR